MVEGVERHYRIEASPTQCNLCEVTPHEHALRHALPGESQLDRREINTGILAVGGEQRCLDPATASQLQHVCPVGHPTKNLTEEPGPHVRRIRRYPFPVAPT